jgi:hypothetical protein
MINHQGKFFGLLSNELVIEKKKCVISVSYKNVLTTKWDVDICREPVHIKLLAKGNQNVFKKPKNCDNSKQEYCNQAEELMSIIQDHGLIFAEGERETISSSHGKVYCISLLLDKYLNEGIIFSSYAEPEDIYTKTSKKEDKKNCDLPPKKKSSLEELTSENNEPEKILGPMDKKIEEPMF